MSCDRRRWIQIDRRRQRRSPPNDGDGHGSLRFLSEWKRHLPKAKVMSWPEYGHYILEDAADELIPAIGGFVRGS